MKNYFFQNVLPVIPKGIHLINQNFYVTTLYKVIRPFLPQKYIDIFHFHGENIEELHEYVPKECLLENFGGTLKDPQITEEQYRKNLEKFDAEYFAINKLGYRNTF